MATIHQRTISQVDAELAAKTRAAHGEIREPDRAELRAEIDALLEERLRLRRPLRPSQVLAAGRR